MLDPSTTTRSLQLSNRAGHGTLIAMILTIGLVSGCRQELNRSYTLYGEASLSALESAPDLTPPTGEPSVTHGHDRRHWPLTNLTVPARQVEHHPSYVFLVQCADETARQRGEAPTVASALETEPRSLVHVGETIVDLGQAALLPITIPVQKIALRRLLWTVERGPSSPTAHAAASPDLDDPARWWTVDPDAAEGNP